MGEIIEQLHDASDKHKNQAIRLTSLMEDMQPMSKKIRYAGEVFSWVQQTQEDPWREKEVCCPGQGQERQRQDRPIWRPEDGATTQEGGKKGSAVMAMPSAEPTSSQSAQLRQEEGQDDPGLLVL